MHRFVFVLSLLIPSTVAKFEETPTWPCPFNPLCYCSSAGPTLARVVCDNVLLTNIPLHLNEFKMYSVTFRHNGIALLEDNRLSGTGIWRAEISHNLITRLSNNSLAGLEHSLQQLILTNNRLLSIPTEAMRNLLKLKQLDLSGNHMTVIQREDFEDFGKTLLSLDLSDNLLNHISNDALHSLDNLETLDLTGNGIVSLSEVLFQQGPTHLRNLYIADNMLRSIPFATLSSLKQLQTLDLKRNLITTVFDVFYQGKLSIDTVILDYNAIERLPPYAFQNFSSINFTSLNGNRIQSLEDDAFNDVRLQVINLAGCGISYISEHAFRGLETSLQSLDLSQNNISEIPQFDNFDNLKNVSFQGNPIIKISAEDFELYPYMLQHVNLLGKEMAPIQTPTIALMRNLRRLSMGRFGGVTISADFFSNFSPALEEFTLNHGGVTTIEDRAFQFTPGIQKLDLSDNSISTIGAKAFSDVGHSLEELILKNALRLSTFPVEAFEPLDRLKTLDLRNSRIKVLPFDSFHSMPDLEFVKMQDNEIQMLEPKTFTGTYNPHLTEIHLSFNKLKTLESASFSGLDKLQILYLDDNQIENIEEHAFINLGALAKLALNGNALVNIVAEALHNLPKLSSLSLAHNHLTNFSLDSLDQVGSLTSLDIDLSHNRLQNLTVNITTFPSYSNIRKIDFSHNNISTIDQYYFEPIKSTMTHLNLKHNILEEVDDKMFNGLSQLQFLDISYNNISILNNSSLTTVHRLQILHLDGNLVAELPANLLEKQSSLRAFYVSNNQLQDINEDLFTATKLEILDISDNQLEQFPNTSLLPVAKYLRCLNISNNGIEYLEPDIMKEFNNLYSLDISRNLLTELEKGIFDSLTELLSLDISHNWVQTLPAHTFLGISHSLISLFIANTSLSTLPLLPFRHLTELNVSSNDITSIAPGAFTNVSELRVLDLSDNHLSSASTSAWHLLPNLYELRLNHNPIQGLTNSSFVGLSSLRNLQLKNLPLRQFQTGAFKVMPALQSLHIDLHSNINGYNVTKIVEENQRLEEIFISTPYKSFTSELHGNLPPHLRKVSLTGRNLTSISSNAFQDIDSPIFHLAIYNTSLRTIPSFSFKQDGRHYILSLDVRDNQLTSLDAPASHTSVYNLQLRGNPWKCDCDIGWIEGWLRMQREDECPESDCTILSRAVREAMCTNYGNRSMLDVFKTELDCEWQVPGMASRCHTKSLSFYSHFILTVLVVRIFY